MAIDLVTERFIGDEMGTSARDSKSYQSTAQRVFDVTVTDPVNDDSSTALIHSIIPLAKISIHPSRPLLCTDVQARRKSPILFEVVASYDSPVGQTSDLDNPLNQPPTIEWGYVASEEDIDEDINGRPIATILGEPIDPPLKITRRDLLLRVGRNLVEFDPSLIVTYTDFGGAVCSDSPFGQPPGTVRVNSLTATAIADPNFPYLKAQCELQFRRGAPRTTDDKAFWRRVRAQGYYVRIDGSDFGLPDMVIRANKNGVPASSPVLHRALDGVTPATPSGNPDGTKAGTQIHATIGDPWPKAEWYEFEVHRSLPFSALGFF